MKKGQAVLGMSCGTLAGFIAGLILYIFLFLIGEDGAYDILRFPLFGAVAGGVIGILLVRFRHQQVQQRRYWRGMGVLLGVLALSPYLAFYLIVLVFALADETEYGPPLAVLGGLLLYVLAGSLAGGLGGLAGGVLFTRLSTAQVKEGD